PVRGWFGAVLTLIAGSLAGGAVGMAMPIISAQVGLLIGLMAGILVASLRSLFAHLPTAGQRPAVLASVALPVAASGIAIYIIGRVLIGYRPVSGPKPPGNRYHRHMFEIGVVIALI